MRINDFLGTRVGEIQLTPGIEARCEEFHRDQEGCKGCREVLGFGVPASNSKANCLNVRLDIGGLQDSLFATRSTPHTGFIQFNRPSIVSTLPKAHLCCNGWMWANCDCIWCVQSALCADQSSQYQFNYTAERPVVGLLHISWW